MADASLYLRAFRGSFTGILRWEKLDVFWENVIQHSDQQWYLYEIGKQVPQQPVTQKRLQVCIRKIDKIIRQQHKEDYCGLVYVDDFSQPTFVKIYDPNNLGKVCGFSEQAPLPGWIFSKIAPIDLLIAPELKTRKPPWWRKILRYSHS